MVFYKLPGLEATALPLELSATAEEVQEYLRKKHNIAASFKLRIWRQRVAIYLAREKTLEESGVKADSTLCVLYTDTAEQKRDRLLQADPMVTLT